MFSKVELVAPQFHKTEHLDVNSLETSTYGRLVEPSKVTRSWCKGEIGIDQLLVIEAKAKMRASHAAVLWETNPATASYGQNDVQSETRGILLKGTTKTKNDDRIVSRLLSFQKSASSTERLQKFRWN